MPDNEVDYRGPLEVTLADVRVKRFGITLNRPDMWVCIWRPNRSPQCRKWKMNHADLNRLTRFRTRRLRYIQAMAEAGRPLFPSVQFPLNGN
jgi:hypothetical protein